MEAERDRLRGELNGLTEALSARDSEREQLQHELQSLKSSLLVRAGRKLRLLRR